MPEVVFKHHTPIQVRFNDLDVLGHVTNAAYQVYYSQAIVSYQQEVLRAGDKHSQYSFVMATITIDYYKSILLDSNIVVHSKVDQMGDKSFDFICKIVDAVNGEVYSQARIREVCYSRALKATIPMPSEWRQRILAFEPTAPEQK